MSFYGSIYYQLVDTFYKVLIKNYGYESIAFPNAPADEYGYQAAGRKGILDLGSGNRWIVFSHDDMTNSFKLWHNRAGGDDLVEIHGFHKIDEVPTGEDVIILSPDDYFMTTEMSQVDAAGHIIPGATRYYKMPKSDVTERLEILEEEVIPAIQELDEKQDGRLDLQEEYVGDWATYRGDTYDSSISDAYDWFPSISMAIGGMSQMIDGTATSSDNMAYRNNQKVSITGAIGNLSDLLESYEIEMKLEPETGSSTVKVHQINLVDVLLYLKDILIANLTTTLNQLITNVDTQGLLLNATSNTVQNDIIPRLEAIEQEDIPGLMQDIEDLTDIHNADKAELVNSISILRTDMENGDSTLNTRITNEVSTLNNTINTKDSDIRALITNEVGTLNNTITANDTAVRGLISDLSDSVDEKEAALTKTVEENRIAAETAHNELSSEVDTNTTAIADISPRLTTAENEIDALQAKDTELSAAISQNQSNISSNTTLIAANTSSISTHTDNITAINNKLGTIPEGSTVVSMIEAAEYDDTELDERITAIEDNYLTSTDKEELSNSIATESGRITAIFDDYLKSADKQELIALIQALDARISSLENPTTEEEQPTE